MAWIESHQSLARHIKTKRLSRKLGASVPAVIGHLHLLWWWALDNLPDGNISLMEPEDIADEMMWEGEAGQLIQALTDVGFLDHTENGLIIHDWHDYIGRLLEKRKKETERKREYRRRTERSPKDGDRNPDRRPAGQDEDETRDGGRNSTVPYLNNKHIADSDECGEMFAEFWSLYPKKQGKAAAEKKWRSLYKQGMIDIDFIIERTEAYIEYINSERARGFDRQYMDGSTFVNQQRWNDDWMPKSTRPTKQKSDIDKIIELNRRMEKVNGQPEQWLLDAINFRS
jgi:hypothetical protein